MLVALVAETMPSVLAHAVQRQHFRARNARLVATRDHAAFTGHDVLGGVEAETPEVAERAGLASVVSGLDGVRAILDHFEVVLARNLDDRVHLARSSREMHRQDRSR